MVGKRPYLQSVCGRGAMLFWLGAFALACAGDPLAAAGVAADITTPPETAAAAEAAVSADAQPAPTVAADAFATAPVPDDPGSSRPCKTSATCQKYWPTTPYCNSGVDLCVQCLTDFNCGADQVCVNSVCVAVACEPGSQVCDGPFVATCAPSGDTYALAKCPEAKPLCNQGLCQFCKPGHAFCAPIEPGQAHSVAVVQCSDDGSTAAVLQNCDASEKCGLGKDLKPHCQTCTPGEMHCDGTKAMVCNEFGGGYDIKDCASAGLVCQGGYCANLCSNNSRLAGTACEAWAVDLGSGGTDDALAIAVANPLGIPGLLSLELGTGQKQAYTVPPLGVATVPLPPPPLQLPPLAQTKTGFNNYAYQLTFSHPMSAVQFKPLSKPADGTGAASQLLPTVALGQEYHVVTRAQSTAALRGYLTVVASGLGTTEVQVVPTAPIDMVPGQSNPALGWAAGVSATFQLAKGQVLNLQTGSVGSDLTGSRVVASEPVVVFAGSHGGFVPNTEACVAGTCASQGWPCATNADCPRVCCADHLETQLWPVQLWSSWYVAAHFTARGNAKDAWRIVASQNGTVVATEPPQTAVPVLAKGQWFELESAEDFVISANHPIELVQFMAGQAAPQANSDTCTGTYLGQKVCKYNSEEVGVPIACSQNSDCPSIPQEGDAGVGDPEMVALPPPSHWPTTAIFVSPPAYVSHFVTIVCKGDTPVKLDDKPVPQTAFVQLQGFGVARLSLAAGTHRLVAQKPVGVVPHGWSAGASYGYAITAQ